MNHLNITPYHEIPETEQTDESIKIQNQIIATGNMCRFYLYLDTIDTELWSLSHILSRSNTPVDKDYYCWRVISLFSELFINGFWYSEEAKNKIIQLFRKALAQYHALFPETTWQNFINGDTRATLLILRENWNLQFSSPSTGITSI